MKDPIITQTGVIKKEGVNLTLVEDPILMRGAPIKGTRIKVQKGVAFKTGDQTEDQTEDQTGDQTEDQIEDQTEGQTEGQTEAIRTEVDTLIGAMTEVVTRTEVATGIAGIKIGDQEDLTIVVDMATIRTSVMVVGSQREKERVDWKIGSLLAKGQRRQRMMESIKSLR